MANPYLQDQVSALQTSATNNLNRNILPQISGGFRVGGGFGSNRQGIAQGLAIEGTNRGIADAATNLYSNAYNIDQNIASQQAMQQSALAAQQKIAEMQDATQRLGLGNQYNLGMGGLDVQRGQLQNQRDIAGMQDATQRFGLQNQYTLSAAGLGLQDKSLDNSFTLGMGNLDLSRQGLGANLVNQGNQGLVNQGQQFYQSGLQEQQMPWNTLQNYGNSLAPFSGLNRTTDTTTPGPNGWQNALAGGITGAQLYQLLFGGKP